MDDPSDITGWQRIDARLTTSGRLSPEDPARLAAMGTARVINLALEDSPGALADEAALMAAAGLDYVHIPVPFDAPGDDHFTAFEHALTQAGDAPVHVHCVMNWRVSAFFCRWNRARGMEPEAARTIMAVQWDPATSDHPAAPQWLHFIERG